MKKLLILAVLGVAGVVFADAALAGRVGNRQVRQHGRIHQGIKSGELTKPEVRRLEREQVRIQKSKRRALSDGALTPKERLRLEKQQDRASKHIYRSKHNDRSR